MSKKEKPAGKKKLILWTSLGILLVAILVGVISWQVARRNDRLRFDEVDKAKSGIAIQLAEHLGDKVVSVEDRNECFNTEQGPYDNGRLWCQVATIIKLDSDIDFRSVGEKLVSYARSKHYNPGSSHSHGVTRYWFETDKDMTCVLDNIDSKGTGSGGSTLKPFTPDDAPAVAVSCADRAKAKHYHYRG